MVAIVMSVLSLTKKLRCGIQVAGGTVYNTLNHFTDVGLLRRVLVHNEYSLYTNTDHHHHFYEASNDQLVDIPGMIDFGKTATGKG